MFSNDLIVWNSTKILYCYIVVKYPIEWIQCCNLSKRFWILINTPSLSLVFVDMNILNLLYICISDPVQANHVIKWFSISPVKQFFVWHERAHFECTIIITRNSEEWIILLLSRILHTLEDTSHLYNCSAKNIPPKHLIVWHELP